jgi:uncharacterized protein YprB with RNaseH-like and TPR domain
MLTRTFCHLKGIGPKSEARLWSRGVLTWDDLERIPAGFFSPRKDALLREQTREARTALVGGDLAYFLARVPAANRVRVLPHAAGSIAYVDIETTGLSAFDRITTIALYDGVTMRTYVRGRDLERFAADIRPYRLLVTYNGNRFDMPLLRQEFGDIFGQPHLDLCPVMHAHGFWGGLKNCERHLGFQRRTPDEMNGAVAVELWHRYERTGDRAALDMLLAYNAEDVRALEFLIVAAYNRSMAAWPMFRPLPAPS